MRPGYLLHLQTLSAVDDRQRMALAQLQEARIVKRLRRLPGAPTPCPQWHRLADHVGCWGPTALQSSLGRHLRTVPDVEGAGECRCLLTSTLLAKRFRNHHLNDWLAELFLSVPSCVKAAGLPEVSSMLREADLEKQISATRCSDGAGLPLTL